MLPGQTPPLLPARRELATEYVVRRRTAFHRVLGFTGRTIDDIVNCPIARREVLGYYKLHRWVERRCEIVELERQWNPLLGTVTRAADGSLAGSVAAGQLRAGATRPARGRGRRATS
ncbi:MAG: hypothetical protein ACK4PI_06425 [Tepidisphaerales bacterium]